MQATDIYEKRQHQAATIFVQTGHGRLYITLNFNDEGKPCRIIITLGKAGGCEAAQLEAISNLITLSLEKGISPEDMAEVLKGITCCPVWDDGKYVHSVADAIAFVLYNWKSYKETKEATDV